MNGSHSEAVRTAWLDLIWRSWRTLGVRASHAPLTEAMVDPESLVIVTAGLTADGTDARVRAHALYWCINNHHLIATARLKRLVKRMPDELTRPFQHFAATVNAVAGTTWPDDGVVADVYDVRETPEVPRASTDRALLKLRLRLLMGANARSEIMATCLALADIDHELRALEQATTFARRNLADPLADLARGGWLDHSLAGNRHRYTSTRRSRNAFGTAIWVDWPSRHEAFTSLARAADMLDEANTVGALAELRGNDELWRTQARLEAPSPLRAHDDLEQRDVELAAWIRGALSILCDVD